MRKCRFLARSKRIKVLKICLIIAMLGQSLLLSGCWDAVDMEHRAFALGLALDKGEKEGEIALTYQIALPSTMYGEGAGGGETVWNLTTTRPSVIQARKRALSRIDKVLNIEHARVLIISDALAREGIRKHMDYFFRDVSIRKRMNVLIAQGKASKVFETKAPTAKSASDYLAEIIQNNQDNIYQIMGDTTLFEVEKNLRRETDFVLQMISSGKEDVAMAEAAIFLKDKLVGTIGPDDIRGIKWLKDDISRGTMFLENIGGVKGQITFEVLEGRTKVKPVIKDGSVDFDVQIRIETILAEMEDLGFSNTVTPEFISACEKALSEKIKQESRHIMERAQQEFEADIFDFGHLVKQYDAEWWSEHENEWRSIFKDSKLNLKVDAYVRRVGLVE